MIRNLPNLIKIFSKYSCVKLVYFFGSRAKKSAGPLSDYDFAIYLNEYDAKKRFDLKLKIFADLSRELKTDKIDVVILNDTQSSEMKYNIIKEGILIYEKEPYKVLIEPKILNQYFDFRQSLLKFNLTHK